MTLEEFRFQRAIKGWNIFFSFLFAVLLALGILYLQETGSLPGHIGLFDFSILVLATLRLIRLFTYDHITLFLREWFLDRHVVKYLEEGGTADISFVQSKNPFKATVSKLLNCPWCLGVWIAAAVTFLFFACPQSWIVFLLLAIAGVASALQILVNLIGWSAERKKQEAQRGN